MLEDELSRVRKPAVFNNGSTRITDMPIRFRCAYCNQLLGISRRKAGTAVRCPTCAGKVIVPNVDADVAPDNSDSSNPLVFERSDFDDLLNTEGESAVRLEKKDSTETAADAPLSSASSPPPGAWGTHPEPAFDVERINPGSLATAESVPQAGIFLSTRNAILLAVAAAVLLGVFFVAGLLIGLWLRPAQESGHGSRDPSLAVCWKGSATQRRY
jgi:DNA-directed RNA polymerase subunit RPC12/RpoP